MEKYLSYSGIIAILLCIIAIIITVAPIDGDAELFYKIGALLTALVFTPLFFINHKKEYDTYKIPCYTASGIIGILLLLGSLLAGTTDSFGEPNFFTGAFMVLCYLIVILLFNPPLKQKLIVITLNLLMIGYMLSEHFLIEAM